MSSGSSGVSCIEPEPSLSMLRRPCFMTECSAVVTQYGF